MVALEGEEHLVADFRITPAWHDIGAVLMLSGFFLAGFLFFYFLPVRPDELAIQEKYALEPEQKA